MATDPGLLHPASGTSQFSNPVSLMENLIVYFYVVDK